MHPFNDFQICALHADRFVRSMDNKARFGIFRTAVNAYANGIGDICRIVIPTCTDLDTVLQNSRVFSHMERISRPTEPAWPGPLRGGITQSIINKFLECPFRFYIYAVLGLEEPSNHHPNLVWGDVFHKGLELIIKHPTPVAEMSDEEFAPIAEEVIDYLNVTFPSAPASYPHTITLMLRLYDDTFKLTPGGPWETEVEFNEPYTSRHGHKVTLRGKLDALRVSTSQAAEHKCKGKFDQTQSRDETPKDLQVNLYAKVKEVESFIYDQIMIPEAQFFLPARRLGESNRNWANRLVHKEQSGKFPVARNRHLWFDQFPVYLDEEGIQESIDFTIDPLIDRICVWWDYVNSPNFDPNDPRCYNHIFYVTPIRHFDPSNTEKFKCNYHSLLCGKTELQDLVPAKFYAELTDES